MATWKELGEVPDSDDESTWESQESQSHALPDPPVPVPASVARESQTVWDIPLSSQLSSQLSSLRSSQLSAVEHNPESHQPDEPDPAPQPPTTAPPSNEARRESTPPLSSLLELGHEIKSNFSIPLPVGPPTIGTTESAPSSPPDIAVFDFPSSIAQEDEIAREEESRLGRSLRPRKPIQEHPYLLESAQYSKTWKSHGLRPVRLLAEQLQKIRDEEDSQEQDFQDDSQATSKGPAQEESGESQTAGRADTYLGPDDLLPPDNDDPASTSELPLPRPEPCIHSSQEDEEFPDPNDIDKWKLNRAGHRKRRSSPRASSRPKRPKDGQSAQATKATPVLFDVDDLFDVPASPPQTSPGVLASTPMTIVNRLGGNPVTTLTPKPSSNMSSRVQSPVTIRRHEEVIDLSARGNGDGGDDSDAPSSPGTSESEHDQVRLRAKRIRGVLPASWLRLDQRPPLQKPKPTARHPSPDMSPERSARKGVAQRRLVSPRPGSSATLFLDDDDSDDSTSSVQHHLPDISFSDMAIPTVEEDAASVMEDDHIDSMFSRGKRASSGSSGVPRKRRKGQKSIFNGQPGQRKIQQRITELNGSTKLGSNPPKRRARVSKGARVSDKLNSITKVSRPPRPPQLGILDVAEPDAPAFIRIAARTAKKRRDQGRSSPSRKAIMLGTRQDTIDAVGVLQRWNEGMIQPRNLARQQTQTQTHPPPRQNDILKSMTQSITTEIPRLGRSRTSRTTSSSRFSQPRRMTKQTSMDKFVNVGVDSQSEPEPSTDNGVINRSSTRDQFSRPAQLEMAGDAANRYTFDVRKRALDALYRRSRKSLPTPRSLRLEQSISKQTPLHTGQHISHALDSTTDNVTLEASLPRKRLRPRKQVQPQSVDILAPQYAHANDPLPRDFVPPILVLDHHRPQITGKLVGLGPYGTRYTQHFEVFPLDQGVYFHESTLPGSGRLQRAVDSNFLGNLEIQRGRCTLVLDEQTLHWGPWDERTSSELGIIFDWVLDRLDTPTVDPKLGTPSPVRAAEFVLVYLQDHLALVEPGTANTFTNRLVHVLQAVEQRVKELLAEFKDVQQSVIEVLTRMLMITMQGLRLCQKLDKLSEAFQMEGILKRLAATTAVILLRADLQLVRDMYGRLQEISFREKGIQTEEYSIICWVSLIRILEEARLPRAGFWEVVSSAIFGPNTKSTCDATVLEQVWSTLFILLPLGEFDNSGIAVPGVRRTIPLEGWTIPQQLLVRVFQLYQSNDRQSPSFNDYLRATMSRCHYLVEQWGWYRCNAILGTIFDFFAAQDLHNLRNEEVYQSPQFLEELSGSPSLAITPGDRCFHIYLKLIAMSIKRLRKGGMTKEIKNLVARLLPNHSRQYDRMIATHEAEIAALRNHHDLLCTLFWAAPSEMRPSVQSIDDLVVLGSSHKEACLINLRAWGRLSRFIVSSSEDISAYRPLAEWQRNISQQVLEQLLSVEAEVNQQLLGMSVEASKNITEQHKNIVISQNRKVALDLLHFSMKTFLDVMRHSRSLGAASFILNHYPLEQILTRLSFSSENLDWGVLEAALDVISYFLTRIDEFRSAEPSNADQSWHEEDAIMLLERKFASPLITIVRNVVNMKPRGVSVSQVGNHQICVEQAVVLAGRLAACLVGARLARFRQFFQAGKYNIFQDISKPTVSTTQPYVALFLATLADRGVEFKDLGVTPMDLVLIEIIKPSEYLAYENRLAMSFKRIGEPYLQDAIIEVGNTPDYSSNRNLFNHIIVSMRKGLLKSDAGQKPTLQQSCSRLLRFVMDRIKSHLKSMALDSAAHLDYVRFVRSIISLIRSQDLCPVDSYFYQISQEYSPSRQDPRLQTAGILSWGLKLEEGDSKAMSGLFYLLFPNFKISLANGELGNEKAIINESMNNTQVFNFMLSTMLPAIIRVTAQIPEGWLLLNTYVEAIDAQLSELCIHREIGDDVMSDVLALYTIILTSVGSLRTRVSPELRGLDILSLTSMVQILNLLSPSVTAYILNNPRSPIRNYFSQVIDEITDFTRTASVSLSDLIAHCDEEQPREFETDADLFDGLGITGPETTLRCNEQINRFANHMTQDIRNNWVSSKAFITIKGPTRPQTQAQTQTQTMRPSATQTGQGTPLPKWSRRELLQNLGEQIRAWNHAHDMMTKIVPLEALLDGLFF
ncbi:Mus7/MMS22 family-domain-containing protein [Astrocystis sublimbata]|nr:Mus7/MMS22 family-domain-containing protein [Astrocystis sublimbata]